MAYSTRLFKQSLDTGRNYFTGGSEFRFSKSMENKTLVIFHVPPVLSNPQLSLPQLLLTVEPEAVIKAQGSDAFVTHDFDVVKHLSRNAFKTSRFR